MHISKPRGPIEVTGDARLECIACVLEVTTVLDAPAYVQVHERGDLVLGPLTKLNFSRIAPPDCAGTAVEVRDWGKLTMDGAAIFGRLDMGLVVYIESPPDNVLDAGSSEGGSNDIRSSYESHLVLRDASIGLPGQDFCANGSILLWAAFVDPSWVTIDIADSSFTGTVQLMGKPKSATIRRSTFAGPIGLQFSLTYLDRYDLGTESDGGQAGGNTFRRPAGHYPAAGDHGVLLDGSGTLRASGNIWMPGEQGADSEGRYPPGTIIQNQSGPNVRADGDNEIQL